MLQAAIQAKTDHTGKLAECLTTEHRNPSPGYERFRDIDADKPCPNMTFVRMASIDNAGDTVRMPIPCRKRDECPTCQENWAKGVLRRIKRDLENHDALYCTCLPAEELATARKYMSRQGKAAGVSHEFIAIRTGTGARLIVATVPVRPSTTEPIGKAVAWEIIVDAVRNSPIDGKRVYSHSDGWMREDEKPPRYHLIGRCTATQEATVRTAELAGREAEVGKHGMVTVSGFLDDAGQTDLPAVKAFWTAAEMLTHNVPVERVRQYLRRSECQEKSRGNLPGAPGRNNSPADSPGATPVPVVHDSRGVRRATPATAT